MVRPPLPTDTLNLIPILNFEAHPHHTHTGIITIIIIINKSAAFNVKEIPCFLCSCVLTYCRGTGELWLQAEECNSEDCQASSHLCQHTSSCSATPPSTRLCVGTRIIHGSEAIFEDQRCKLTEHREQTSNRSQ